MTDHETLAAALAAFQSSLPEIAKAETAKVETKGGGSYSYSYAGLGDVSRAVLPKLAEHGLSFSARPTFDGDRFVLAYQLLHASGEVLEGAYPLPNATPQQVGSAITYARRYCLCAVTGVAPDDDDDGRAAQQAKPQPKPAAQPEPAPEHFTPQQALEHVAESTPDANAVRWVAHARWGTSSFEKLSDEQARELHQELLDNVDAVFAEARRVLEGASE